MISKQIALAAGALAVSAMVASGCGQEQPSANASVTQPAPGSGAVSSTAPQTASTPAAPLTSSETTTNMTVYMRPPSEVPVRPSGGPTAGTEGHTGPTTADAKRIGIDEVEALLQSGDAVIVDVRNEEAFEFQHIAGAKHIPLDELGGRALQELPPTRWIIPYCT